MSVGAKGSPTMKEMADPIPPGMGFLTVVLWLCAAGALWLLLSPAAFQRRILTARAREAAVAAETERLRVQGLERWRDGLENDPAVIEREGRKLGYGHPDERSYPLSPVRDLADAETVWRRNANEAEQARDDASRADRETAARARKAVGAALMAILGGAIAFLFFRDLRIDDPGDPLATGEANEESP